MAGRLRAAGSVLVSSLLLSCASAGGHAERDGGPDGPPTHDGGGPVQPGDAQVDDVDADVPVPPFPVGCLDAEGREPVATALVNGAYQASAAVSGEACARSYALTTN